MKPERIQIIYLGGQGPTPRIALRRQNRVVTFDLEDNRVRQLELADGRDLCQDRRCFAELITNQAFAERFGLTPPGGVERHEGQVILSAATMALARRAQASSSALGDSLEAADYPRLQAMAKALGLKAAAKKDELRLAVRAAWQAADEPAKKAALEALRGGE